MYPKVQLLIDGQWCDSASGDTLAVVNPASGETIGTVARAGKADLDRALEAAAKGFQAWRKVGAFDRYKVMRKAADLLRSRADNIAPLMTQEQGKPIAEARMEVLAGADVIDWFAEEARRTYGRIVPARAEGVMQLVVKEPVGPVAAFTPWNFPINQAVRKISAGVPYTRPSTPGGRSASANALMSAAGAAGVSSAALTSIEQPAASAAATLRTTWLIGKFHGVNAATGPTGSFITICRIVTLTRDGTMRP